MDHRQDDDPDDDGPPLDPAEVRRLLAMSPEELAALAMTDDEIRAALMSDADLIAWMLRPEG